MLLRAVVYAEGYVLLATEPRCVEMIASVSELRLLVVPEANVAHSYSQSTMRTMPISK